MLLKTAQRTTQSQGQVAQRTKQMIMFDDEDCNKTSASDQVEKIRDALVVIWGKAKLILRSANLTEDE